MCERTDLKGGTCLAFYAVSIQRKNDRNLKSSIPDFGNRIAFMFYHRADSAGNSDDLSGWSRFAYGRDALF